MSNQKGWGFGLPRGMTWQDLGVTEFLKDFSDRVAVSDYERQLPVRAAQATRGRWGFGLPKGVVWKDLGITERFNPFGSIKSRVEAGDDAFVRNLQNIATDDYASGMFDQKNVVGQNIFPANYKPPIALNTATGMSNIPVGTKEAEIAMRQEQGGYIPPGMGVPAQPGGSLNAKDQWLADTANSPAAKAGVFSPDERWNQHLKHQAWKKEMGRGFTHGEFL